MNIKNKIEVQTTIDDIAWRRECVERYYAPRLAAQQEDHQPPPDFTPAPALTLEVNGREMSDRRQSEETNTGVAAADEEPYFEKFLEPVMKDGVLARLGVEVDALLAGSDHGATYEGRNVSCGSRVVVKLERSDAPHPNKRNNLTREAEIAWNLNARGASFSPACIASGQCATGVTYLVTERVAHRVDPSDESVLAVFFELARLGYVHGDLKSENLLSDGERTYLVDYDQTVEASEVATMSAEELCRWADELPDRLPFLGCGSLLEQLSRFGWASGT